MMYGFGYGPEFAFMHILNWIFWIAIVVLVVRLIRGRRWSNPGNWRAPWENRGLDVLNERFAKGEISKEEYEEKKKVLTDSK